MPWQAAHATTPSIKRESHTRRTYISGVASRNFTTYLTQIQISRLIYIELIEDVSTRRGL
jgi:hypothetical protein